MSGPMHINPEDAVPRRADLSDEELFSDFPGVRRGPEAEDAARKKAKVVIELLSSAGLQSSFGINLDKAEEEWAVELAPYDLIDLVNGCRTYIADRKATAFPPLGAVMGLASDARAARLDFTRRDGEPDQCDVCLLSGWVEHYPDGTTGPQGGPSTKRCVSVAPCPYCRPSTYSWTTEGHADWKHNAGRCKHPICIHRTQRGRRHFKAAEA